MYRMKVKNSQEKTYFQGKVHTHFLSANMEEKLTVENFSEVDTT